MAKEKKPSIYSDRGTIGSSEELDEYGVWVKSEPQDLTSEEMETPEINVELPGEEDMDFAIPEIEDLPDLGSFDEKSSGDSSIAELPTDDFTIPDIDSVNETETGNVSLVSDESGSDDFNLGDLTEESELGSLDIPVLEESTDSSVLENSLGITDLEKPELDDELNIPEIKELDQENLSPDADLSGAESDDEYSGISIDTSMDDLRDDSMDKLIEDFDSEVDGLLNEDMEVIGHSDESAELSPGVVNETYAPSSVPIHTEIRQETGSPKDTGLMAASSSPDLSTQLLMKIAEELSSIRVELSSLKKEFSGIRVAAPPAETEEGGFFDKEDDEKISLTGDELNNILNTADFTEETGTDVTMGLPDDGTGDSDSLAADPNMGIHAGSVSLDLPDDIGSSGEAAPGFVAEEAEAKEGKPITHDLTTEDTNYLAKEPVEAEVSINLEEAVIDEPDLSSEIQDNPIEEPLPDDLSVTVDTEEPVPVDLPATVDTEEPVPDDLSVTVDTEEPVPVDLAATVDTEEPVPDDLSVTVDTEEPVPVDLPATVDIEGQVSEDTGSEEPGNLDITSEELGDFEISAEDLAIDEFKTEEPGIEPSGTEDINIEELAAEEPGTEPLNTEDLSTEDLSILELGADNFDFTEPAIGEPGTETTGEEPVVLEEPGIPAVDEHEDDLGILVADEGPSGEITGVAEEPHGEAAVQEAVSTGTEEIAGIPVQLKQELKTVLSYMDQLLEALPDEKIEEFARSEHYDTYKKLFKELGIS